MNKFFTPILLLCSVFVANAQVQPFGKVDTADLKLTTCDFEKGANAMVLLDEAKVYYRFSTVVMERHKRIKIFNEKGSDQAQVKIEYLGVHHDEFVTDVEAQTINFENNSIRYIPVDKTLIYKQNVDRETNAIVFTFPDIKPGSIVEFKYRWSSPYAGNFPNWVFQDVIPTRYSEFQFDPSNDYTFNVVTRIRQSLAKDTSVFRNGKNSKSGYTRIWALNNVPSLKDEPYMSSMQDNIQELLFQVTARFGRYWPEVALGLLKYEDFGTQLDTTMNLNNEGSIIAKVNELHSSDEKIAYLFNTVKSTIKWNNLTRFYTEDGVRKAWNRKTGNSAEINMILYHYLKKAGIKTQVMVVNTDDKLDPYYASMHQLNNVVAYVMGDDKIQYVLDASQKDGLYNELPFYLLNSNGIVINQEKRMASLINFNDPSPKRNAIFVSAEITPDAKMIGTAQISNSSYNKIAVVKQYMHDGEANYKISLQDKNNNLKITSLKLENMEADSLALTQNIEFNLDLNGSDENYIYFAPNLFTGLNSNPFLDEERYSHIDFKFLRTYYINGRYKIPSGFKIDALPKNMNLLMPDSSISFKRIVASEDGFVVVHYVIDFKRSYYTAVEYQPLFEFYRKMHEMLNEQIVLKKG